MQFAAFLRRNEGALILMYHSVADKSLCPFIDPANHVPAEVFAKQMDFLARHRRVVPLNQLVEELRQGKKSLSGTIAITFDDGYLDNLTIAAPILEKHGFPATLFLPTGYIDRGETQWIDQAYTAFTFRTKNALLWKTESSEHIFNLDETAHYTTGYQAVCNVLLRASGEDRHDLLNSLYDRLRPTVEIPRLSMKWNDIRTLLHDYSCFQIGGHTLEHTDLTSIPSVNAKREIHQCLQRIYDKTGTSPSLFSFCYGRTSESLRRLVHEAGIQAACGGDGLDPVITPPADLLRLPRVAAPASMDGFDILTSAANTGIWRRLGR